MILSTSLYVKFVAYDGYIDASGNVVENTFWLDSWFMQYLCYGLYHVVITGMLLKQR